MNLIRNEPWCRTAYEGSISSVESELGAITHALESVPRQGDTEKRVRALARTLTTSLFPRFIEIIQGVSVLAHKNLLREIGQSFMQMVRSLNQEAANRIESPFKTSRGEALKPEAETNYRAPVVEFAEVVMDLVSSFDQDTFVKYPQLRKAGEAASRLLDSFR